MFGTQTEPLVGTWRCVCWQSLQRVILVLIVLSFGTLAEISNYWKILIQVSNQVNHPDSGKN